MYRVGKHQTCDIRLPEEDKSISRVHATLNIGLGPLQNIFPPTQTTAITSESVSSPSSSLPTPISLSSSSSPSSAFPASVIAPVKLIDTSTYGTTVTPVQVVWRKGAANRVPPAVEGTQGKPAPATPCHPRNENQEGSFLKSVSLDTSEVLPGMSDYHPPPWMFPSQQYEDVREVEGQALTESRTAAHEGGQLDTSALRSFPSSSLGFPRETSAFLPSGGKEMRGTSTPIKGPHRLQKGMPYSLPIGEMISTLSSADLASGSGHGAGEHRTTARPPMSSTSGDFWNVVEEGAVRIRTAAPPFPSSFRHPFGAFLELPFSRLVAPRGPALTWKATSPQKETMKEEEVEMQPERNLSSGSVLSFSPFSVAHPSRGPSREATPLFSSSHHHHHPPRHTAFEIHLGHRGTLLLLVWVEVTALVEDIDLHHATTLASQLQQCGIRVLTVPTLRSVVDSNKVEMPRTPRGNAYGDGPPPCSPFAVGGLPFIQHQYEDYSLVDAAHFYITDGLPPSVAALRLLCRGIQGPPCTVALSGLFCGWQGNEWWEDWRNATALTEYPVPCQDKKGSEGNVLENRPGSQKGVDMYAGRSEWRSEDHGRTSPSSVFPFGTGFSPVVIARPDYVTHLLEERLLLSEPDMERRNEDHGQGLEGRPRQGHGVVSSSPSSSSSGCAPWPRWVPPLPQNFPPSTAHAFWPFMLPGLSSLSSSGTSATVSPVLEHLSRFHRSHLLKDFLFIVVQPKLWNEVQGYIPAAEGIVCWDPFVKWYLTTQLQKRKKTLQEGARQYPLQDRDGRAVEVEGGSGAPHRVEEGTTSSSSRRDLEEIIQDCVTTWITSYHVPSVLLPTPCASSTPLPFVYPSLEGFLPTTTTNDRSTTLSQRSLVILYNKDEALIDTDWEKEVDPPFSSSSCEEMERKEGEQEGTRMDGEEDQNTPPLLPSESGIDSPRRTHERRRSTSGNTGGGKLWSMWIAAVHAALTKVCREQQQTEKEEKRRATTQTAKEAPHTPEKKEEQIKETVMLPGCSRPVFSFLRCPSVERVQALSPRREEKEGEGKEMKTPPLFLAPEGVQTGTTQRQRGKAEKQEEGAAGAMVPLVEYAELLASVVSGTLLPAVLSRSPSCEVYEEECTQREEKADERRVPPGPHKSTPTGNQEEEEAEEEGRGGAEEIDEVRVIQEEEDREKKKGRGATASRPSAGTLLFLHHDTGRGEAMAERSQSSPSPSPLPTSKEENVREVIQGDDDGWRNARRGKRRRESGIKEDMNITCGTTTATAAALGEGSGENGRRTRTAFLPPSVSSTFPSSPWDTSLLASYPCFSGFFSQPSIFPPTVSKERRGCVPPPYAFSGTPLVCPVGTRSHTSSASSTVEHLVGDHGGQWTRKTFQKQSLARTFTPVTTPFLTPFPSTTTDATSLPPPPPGDVEHVRRTVPRMKEEGGQARRRRQLPTPKRRPQAPLRTEGATARVARLPHDGQGEEEDFFSLTTSCRFSPLPASSVPPILMAQLCFQGKVDDSEEDDDDDYGKAGRRNLMR